MNKLIIIPILFALAFSQNKSNQVLYAIETTTANYNNVSLESVYGLGLELYDRELNNKLNIPITEIKTLKQNGWKTNDIATFIFTIGGGFGGIFGWWWFSGEGIGGLYDPLYTSQINNDSRLIGLGASGGGAMLGYKLTKNIFKQKYKPVEFERWSLDEKINYLKSIANQ